MRTAARCRGTRAGTRSRARCRESRARPSRSSRANAGPGSFVRSTSQAIATPSTTSIPAASAAIQQRIADHARRVGEHDCVVRQREAVGQHGEAPDLGEREQQNAQVRRKHEREHEQHPAVRERSFPSGEPAPRALPFRRAPASRSRARARCAPRAHSATIENATMHHADDVADRILEADRRDAQVRLRREHVGDVEHERRAEVVEDLDEHQRCAGDVAGQRERKHDAAEQPEAAARRGSAPPPPSRRRCWRIAATRFSRMNGK